MPFLLCLSSVIMILTDNKLLRIYLLPLTMSLFSAFLTPNCNLQMCFIQALPQPLSHSKSHNHSFYVLLQSLTLWCNTIHLDTIWIYFQLMLFFGGFFASNHSRYTQQIITDTIRLMQETNHTKNTVACPLDTRWQMVFTDIINSSPLCPSSQAH